MYKGRIENLEFKHKTLDKQIAALEKTGSYTDDHLTELKKQKLAIKDELSKLHKSQFEHDREILDHGED
jgi:hypothetical protein